MEVYLFRDAKPSLTLQQAVDYLTSFQTDTFGCMWLHHSNATQLAIMINGRQTYPHFFPAGDHPGWQVAAKDDADWDTEIDFLADNHEPTPMPLALAVSVDRTVEILTHYWHNGSRTEVETWASLIDGEP